MRVHIYQSTNRAFTPQSLRRVQVPKSEPGFLRPVMIAACLLSILSAFLIVAFAHDIPNDVTVQAFLKPEGQHLYFLARVPLKGCADGGVSTGAPRNTLHN